MKKEQIIEALKKQGIELSADKEKELIKELNILNDADIQNAKKDYEAKDKQIEELKANYEKDLEKSKQELSLKDIELKKYGQGGEKFVDLTEIEALKKFKNDTVEKENNVKKENAILELLRASKFDAKAEKLLLKAVPEYNPEFDDEFQVKNADKIKEALTKDYSSFIVQEQTGGAKASTQPPANGASSKTLSLTDAIAENMSAK